MSGRRKVTGLLVLAVLASTTAVGAATFPLDDSASIPGAATIKMRWRSVGPTRLSGNMVDGASVVTVNIATGRWVGRVARVYMTLPEQPIGPVTVDWTTGGRLLPGALTSGDRGLVYAGPISSAMLSDTLSLQVHTDGRRLESAQPLKFTFEIDVE